jgi:hypothetical protein
MPRGRPRKTADGALIRSAEMIGWAIGGLEREIAATRNRLSSLTSEAAKLRKRIGQTAGEALSAAGAAANRSSGTSGTSGTSRKRRMSPEGRKKIADAAKRRWAKWRAENKGR